MESFRLSFPHDKYDLTPQFTDNLYHDHNETLPDEDDNDVFMTEMEMNVAESSNTDTGEVNIVDEDIDDENETSDISGSDDDVNLCEHNKTEKLFDLAQSG